MIVSFSIAGRRAAAGAAGSPCWQVFGLVVYGSEPLRASGPARGMLRAVFYAGDFSTNAHE